ncbi:hypothetical protein BCR32DRAFT_282306 [Anaeromyces robustus]|uniref:Uncharacterized protein n=1 Tax=Anaeromyces robustus TaxID=1754192 RepID=A0A1Y1WZB0_9FUNG|nr:hypothetical protein BCR32DRAFT_282306 [Anaeromyces robustus]|eukprot:ORX78424.1 hypothetical protein BCR32DRAFT_282306 [Anaeromyces robustus]
MDGHPYNNQDFNKQFIQIFFIHFKLKVSINESKYDRTSTNEKNIYLQTIVRKELSIIFTSLALAPSASIDSHFLFN